jgi:hypothetical protein
MIIENARKKIDRFNKIGLHYNITANHVYKKRNLLQRPFKIGYLPFIIAGLICFDMERMMGRGAKGKYDINEGGFATLLNKKIAIIKPKIKHLIEINIVDINLENERQNIEAAYKELSAGGEESLNQRGGEFHVGATKILHFINPELFIIIDSNAARAFNRYHGINYRNTTQPGYTSEKYIRCMSIAKADIIGIGLKKFRSLDDGIPVARIYDKLTFVTGTDLQ